MIKKSLGKALVGTVAAGALALPAATVVAPSMQLMACEYPNSINTTTDVIIEDPLVRPGEAVHVDVIVDAGGKDPRGRVILTVTGPKGTQVREKKKDVDDGTISFALGSFKLGKKQDEKTFRVTARFRGNCRFQNSSGVAYFTVARG